jgi:hypothetical protein
VHTRPHTLARRCRAARSLDDPPHAHGDRKAVRALDARAVHDRLVQHDLRAGPARELEREAADERREERLDVRDGERAPEAHLRAVEERHEVPVARDGLRAGGERLELAFGAKVVGVLASEEGRAVHGLALDGHGRALGQKHRVRHCPVHERDGREERDDAVLLGLHVCGQRRAGRAGREGQTVRRAMLSGG